MLSGEYISEGSSAEFPEKLSGYPGQDPDTDPVRQGKPDSERTAPAFLQTSSALSFPCFVMMNVSGKAARNSVKVRRTAVLIQLFPKRAGV